MALNRAELDAQQYAVADFDLMWCERYLVVYVELMTPPASNSDDPWKLMKSREFSDPNFKFIDIHGRALVTSIVISYIRPWSNNKRPDGSKVKLPERIIRELAKVSRRDDEKQPLLPFHQAIHARLLGERNTVVAHSDLTKWGFVVSLADPNSVETKLKDPFRYLNLKDARQLLDNTRALRAQLNLYKRQTNSRIRNAKP